jgi:hypothetical protein
MAVIAMTCPDCSQPAELGVGQSFALRDLVWWESVRCKACGLATEADGYGLPPESFRDSIIDDDGYFVLSVPTAERVKTLHVLNAALKIPMNVLGEMMKRLPGNILGGTRVEMQWLQTTLEDFRIDSTVEQVDRESLPVDLDLPQSHCRIAHE